MPSDRANWDEISKIFQSGDLITAERRCSSVLQTNPDFAPALHMLGRISTKQGAHQKAAEHLEKAHKLEPLNLEVSHSFSIALIHLKRLERAEEIVSAALKVNPKYVPALNQKGSLAHLNQRHDEAKLTFQRVLAIDPKNAIALNNLAASFASTGDHVRAKELVERCTSNHPNSVEVMLNAAKTMRLAGDIQRAHYFLKKVLAIEPNSAEALEEIGSLYLSNKEFEQADAYFRDALRSNPKCVMAHVNLGLSHRLQEKPIDAKACFETARLLSPKTPDSYVGLAILADDEQDAEAAKKFFDIADDLAPGLPRTKHCRSVSQLRSGDLVEGWQNHAARWARSPFKEDRRPFAAPEWRGEPSATKSILVWNEQGVGEEILCASMYAELADKWSKVTIECDPRLTKLFRRSFPNVSFVGRSNPPAPELSEPSFDFQIAALDLGTYFRQDFAAFPKHSGFLCPEWPRVQGFRQKIRGDLSAAKSNCPIVGLSWHSDSKNFGKSKSLDLIGLAPILKNRGVKFVSLQYGDVRDEIENVSREISAAIQRIDDLDCYNDLDGLSALVAACDLIITNSSVTAHLAGALGVPTYLMVPRGPSLLWYWFVNRDDSPWYPSVRLFRQSKPGQWKDVIKAVNKQFEKWIG
ncbi:MAG: tetratricopeptide repeat protein [Rhodobacteraceae bacterium]|nr:tetratricopeptide repeat protein [Paracoccaceae bacterium]